MSARHVAADTAAQAVRVAETAAIFRRALERCSGEDCECVALRSAAARRGGKAAS